MQALEGKLNQTMERTRKSALVIECPLTVS